MFRMVSWGFSENFLNLWSEHYGFWRELLKLFEKVYVDWVMFCVVCVSEYITNEEKYDMANPFYVPAKIREELVEKLSEHSITCTFCGEILKRARDRNVDFINYEVENVFILSNSVICCVDCLGARRRRPIGVFMDERFTELTVALAWVSTMRTKALLERFSGAATPKAVRPAVRETPNPPAVDLGSLVDNWDSDDAPVDVSSLHHADPRLDMDHAEFDEDLYNQWIIT